MGEYPCSLTVFGLPRSHWHCTLQNFEWSPSLERAVRAFTEGTYRHLILTGDPGLGKSHLSVALYRWAVAMWGSWTSLWLDFPQFCQEVKRGYGKYDALEAVEEARDLVVLDDIFGRELSRHEQETILYTCIQTVHRNQARLVVTTNFDLSKLGTMLNNHELDRLLESSAHVDVRGASRR